MSRVYLFCALFVSVAASGFTEEAKQAPVVQQEIVQQEEELAEEARDPNIVSSDDVVEDPLQVKLFGF